MNKYDLIERNKLFVLDIVSLCDKFPKTNAFNIFSKQLIRSSSSIGANYRAACRAKSDADFINKLKIVEEDTDESIYFLELLKELDSENSETINKLLTEANELLAIYIASIKTTRERIKKIHS